MKTSPVAPKSGDIVSIDVWGTIEKLKKRHISPTVLKERDEYKAVLRAVWDMLLNMRPINEIEEFIYQACPWLNE